MSIPEFPNEVLLCIFEYALHIKSYERRQNHPDLKPVRLIEQIAQCSHRFYDLASQIMYKTVSFDGSGGFFPPTFLRLLIRRPAVKDCVKHLSFMGHKFANVEFRMLRFENADFILCEEAIQTLTSVSKPWLRELTLGSFYHTISLITLQLSMLESITVSYDTLLSMAIPLAGCVEGFEKLYPSLLSRFERLRKVCIRDVWSFSRSTRANGCYDRAIRDFDWSLVNMKGLELQLTTVDHLQLLNCSMSLEELAALLNAFPRISRFDVELYVARWRREDRWQEGLEYAISNLKSSLTQLNARLISPKSTGANGMPVTEDIFSFSLHSIVYFEKVTKLITDVCTLMDASYDCRPTTPKVVVIYDEDAHFLYKILPRSLQILELYCCNTKILRQLEMLIQHQREFIPALKQVYVESCCANMIVRYDRKRYYHDWWDEENALVEKLQMDFKLSGVALTVEHRYRQADISFPARQW